MRYILALILWSVAYVSQAADAKPVVPNPSGGVQAIQPGQTLFVPLSSGAFSAIPAAASANTAQIYWATDTQTLYRSNGSTWVALSGGGTPGGSAGGDLSGSYPSPTVAGIKGAAVPSLVSGAFLKLTSGGSWEFVGYGTGADQPAAGNDSRFANSRAPSGAASGDLSGTYPSPMVAALQGVSLPAMIANNFLKLNGSNVWELVPYGTGADTVAQGNDSRLSDSRAPNGSASGDLSGSYPSPTVAAINGVTLGSMTPTAGHALVANGSQINSVAISGDATLGSSGTLTLKNTGTAGTYTQVTTDAQGRVASGASPTTLSGYGITNAVANGGGLPSISTGLLSARPSASVAGRVYVASDTGALYQDSGSAWSLLLPSLTGDVSSSGTATTLAASGASAGTYGSSTTVPQVTVDAKGRVTSASNVAIAPSAGSLTGIVGLANGGTAANLSATGGSGQVLKQTTSGGAVTVAPIANSDLPASGVTPGTYGLVTVNAQGIATAATAPTTLSGYGITNGVANAGSTPSVATGNDSSKPVAGVLGRIYFATDTLKVYSDNGSTWLLMLPALSGDLTTSGTAATLAASGVSAGTYGDSGDSARITVDAKGRATAITTQAIGIDASRIITGTLSVPHGGTGVAAWTDGQVGIGRSSDGALVPAQITGSATISVTPGAGSLVLAAIQPTSTANTVMAGPVSGGSATMAPRALVAADIPPISVASGVTGILPVVNGGLGANLSTATAGQIVTADGAGNFATVGLIPGAGITVTNGPGASTTISATGSGGTVTSVGLTLPSLFSVTGSPVTGSGVLAATYNSQTANTFLAGPVSGSAAAPTMRAIVPADMPVMVASGSGHAPGAVPDPGATSGTTHYLREDGTWDVPAGSGSGTVTSVNITDGTSGFLSPSGGPITTSGAVTLSLGSAALPVLNGGTGNTSVTAHGMLVGNGASALTVVAPSTSGYVWTSNGVGADPNWQASAGGGTIGGSIAANQVAVGSASNAIGGSSALTYSGGILAATGVSTSDIENIAGASSSASYHWQSGSTEQFQLYVNSTVNSGAWELYDSQNSRNAWSYIPGPSTSAYMSIAAKLDTQISTTSQAGFNIAPGGSAPTSPVNGDVWCDASNGYIELNGTTINFTQAAQYAGNVNGSLVINKTSTVTSGNQAGIIVDMIHSGGSGTNYVQGVNVTCDAGSQAIADAPAFWSQGTANTGGGTIVRTLGHRVTPSTLGSGGNVGYYIDISGDSTSTTFTGNWGFYNGANSNNQFGTGTTTIGTASITALKVLETGSAATLGHVTLSAGGATVNTTACVTASEIFLTEQALGTVSVPSALCVVSRVSGTSFTIKASAATDTSVVSWHIINPGP